MYKTHIWGVHMFILPTFALSLFGHVLFQCLYLGFQPFYSLYYFPVRTGLGTSISMKNSRHVIAAILTWVIISLKTKRKHFFIFFCVAFDSGYWRLDRATRMECPCTWFYTSRSMKRVIRETLSKTLLILRKSFLPFLCKISFKQRNGE